MSGRYRLGRFRNLGSATWKIRVLVLPVDRAPASTSERDDAPVESATGASMQ